MDGRGLLFQGALAIEGTITDLKIQKRNDRRVNIYLDGEFGFGLAHTLATGLSVGDHLSADEIEDLRSKDSVEEARRRANRLIGRRPRSEFELRRYFDRKEIPPSVQDEVIEDLKDVGLVNDHEFAETWVENRSAFRPRGAFALRSELREKGVPRPAIEAALEEFDERSAAIKAGKKAFRRYQDLSWQEFRQRVGGYLKRRGFGYSLISSVIDLLWEEKTEAESEVSE